MSRRLWILVRGVACLALVVAVGLASPAARADWDPGNAFKMHYPQLPDLTSTGLNVLDTHEPGFGSFRILADDWLCTATGPVSGIHIWGSWLNDVLPNGDAGAVGFKLSIHADIPPSQTGGFSQPGEELWSEIFRPGTFQTRFYGSATELFYDPNSNQVIGTDLLIWQYNFTNIPRPFIQQVGTIYWLDVQALPLDLSAFFGWKTTNPLDPRTPHFRDDAVFANTAGFDGPLVTPWAPMVYPAGHPLAGRSIDQAFVITSAVPEPSAFVLAGFGLGGLVLVARRRARTRG